MVDPQPAEIASPDVPFDVAHAPAWWAPSAEVAVERLNAHVVEMVQFHFSPETGCPYWLDKAKSFDFNPLTDINTFADLIEHVPAMPEEVLKQRSLEHLIPKAFEGQPYHVFCTGGTTSGFPSRRPDLKVDGDFHRDYAELSTKLPEEFFPMGANWLHAGPSGPRRLPHAIPYLAELRGAAFTQAVDFDPVAVKRLIDAAKENPKLMPAVDLYMNHLRDQAIGYLRSEQFGCMFTSPPMLERITLKLLEEGKSLADFGIKGVFTGGTQLTPEFLRVMMELNPGVGIVPCYGNTLMGLAMSLPVTAENGCLIDYYAPQPNAVIELVDLDDHSKLVTTPGTYGRVRITTMTKGLLAVATLERDEAELIEPCDLYPWHGVRGVRPFGDGGKGVTVGAY